MELDGADVISKARSCIETAQEIYRIITASEEQHAAAVERVDIKLQSLEEDGHYLLLFSQRQKNALQKKEKEYEEEIKTLSKERGKVETEKQKSMSQKSSLEAQQSSLRSTRDTHQRKLNDAQSSLSNAEAELRDAQDKLRRARNERKSTKAKGMGTGAFVGFLLLGPIGAVAGAAAGTAAGKAISDGEVNNAQSAVEVCRSRVSNAEAELANADCALQDVNNQISRCKAKIHDCEDKSKILHSTTGNIQESIVINKKDIHVWGVIGNMSQNATEQTSYLKMIMQNASKTKYNLVTSDGTKNAAKLFLEAWKKLTRQLETLFAITIDDTQTVPQALSNPNDPEAYC